MTMEMIKGLKPGDKVMWVHKAFDWMAVTSADKGKIYHTPAEIVFVQEDGRFASLKALEPMTQGRCVVPCVMTAWPEQIHAKKDLLLS